MDPAAPQASRPDLPSNSTQRGRDKYTRIAGMPASGSASQVPVGAALQRLPRPPSSWCPWVLTLEVGLRLLSLKLGVLWT